jgi:predicted phosphodiesterase
MKLLLLGDGHQTARRPRSRVDDYIQAQRDKRAWIRDFALDQHVGAIIWPGDILDRPTEPHWLTNEMILDYKNATFPIPNLIVLGQHDLIHHNMNNMMRTATGALLASGAMTLLTDKPYKMGEVHFYGCSWKQQIPEIEDPKAYNVLVMHRMMVKDKKAWEFQEEYYQTTYALAKNDFKLIVTGDNHATFTDSSRTKWLVNAGSLMRSTKAQTEHRPCVFVCDTEDMCIYQHFIPCAPASEVFDVDIEETDVNTNKELEAFIAGLEDTSDMGLDFVKNLQMALEENPVSKGVKTILEDVIAESMEGQ